MRRKHLILQILATPLTVFLGFVAGLLILMSSGLLLFDNYEYFMASDGPPLILGIVVMLGSTIGGALAPWWTRKL